MPQTKEQKKTTKDRDRIGVLFYGDSKGDFFNSVLTGINAALPTVRSDPKMDVRFSPMNAADQIRILDEMTKEPLKGLIISPIDDISVAKRIRALTDKGVPVVTVHTDIADSGRIAYVGTDPYKAGRVAASQMCLMCEPKTEVGIVTGFHGIKGHEQRIKGFEDYLAENDKGLTVECIGECRDDDYKAYELVQKMQSDHPGISAFFFATTGGIYGGCKGIWQMTTRLSFHVVTLDVLSATRDFMRKGLIDSSIYQNPKNQGALALKILTQKIYEGKDPEREINLSELSIKTAECLYL